MVASRPSSIFDLGRVRSHEWDRNNPIEPTCVDCTLVLTLDDPLADLPPCPGPGYVLASRNTLSRPGRHKGAR